MKNFERELLKAANYGDYDAIYNIVEEINRPEAPTMKRFDDEEGAK
jgi:hypothetical protein